MVVEAREALAWQWAVVSLLAAAAFLPRVRSAAEE